MEEWLQLFEYAGCLFREIFLLPLYRRYPNYNENIWDSLSIFFQGPAFERQGRRPDYAHAAVDALHQCREELHGNFTQEVTQCLWRRFSNALNNENLNHKNNPLYPSYNPDGIENIAQMETVVALQSK